jgi:hypothetical protein
LKVFDRLVIVEGNVVGTLVRDVAFKKAPLREVNAGWLPQSVTADNLLILVIVSLRLLTPNNVKLPVIVIIVGDDGVEEYVYEGSFDVILVWIEVPSPQLIVKGVVIFLIGILIIVPFTIFIYSNNIYLFR